MLTKFLIVLIVSHLGALLGLESANNNSTNIRESLIMPSTCLNTSLHILTLSLL